MNALRKTALTAILFFYMTSIRFIRPAELAEMISVSKSTLWRMEKEGELPPRRKISKRCVGWVESDILKWLQNLPVADDTDL